jgi:thiol:disulfide interchange protein DsbD
MALTTVIVSFSCTGPFIGYLIIEAVQGGGIRPLLGMFFYGLAFATPFTLLAIFPSAMKKMPKSGGWLNSVKVVFAFILLAFSLKFISNIDQVYGFNILNRDLFLSIWIVIFVMLGMYLLGKIKFAHDSDLKHVGIFRFVLALASMVFALYLFTGLLGAPLKPISSLIPPQTVVHANIQTVDQPTASAISIPQCGPAKYADKLHLPYGLTGYFDYEQGMACAKEQNKPVFLVFKGHACANCKKMENSVWDQPEVIKMLKNDYVVIALYTDDRTELPQSEWKTSTADGKILKTMGRINLDLLMSKYDKNSIPFHVIIKPDGTEYKMDATYDNQTFSQFLADGLNK